MKLRELLTELADKPYEILISDHSANSSWYGFETESGLEYKIVFNYKDDAVNVTFAMISGGSFDDSLNGQANSQSLRIMSTVMFALRDVLSRKPDIQQIVFAGRTMDSSRIRLYSRIAKNIGRYIPRWSFENEQHQGEHVIFSCIKI